MQALILGNRCNLLWLIWVNGLIHIQGLPILQHSNEMILRSRIDLPKTFAESLRMPRGTFGPIWSTEAMICRFIDFDKACDGRAVSLAKWVPSQWIPCTLCPLWTDVLWRNVIRSINLGCTCTRGYCGWRKNNFTENESTESSWPGWSSCLHPHELSESAGRFIDIFALLLHYSVIPTYFKKTTII